MFSPQKVVFNISIATIFFATFHSGGCLPLSDQEENEIFSIFNENKFMEIELFEEENNGTREEGFIEIDANQPQVREEVSFGFSYSYKCDQIWTSLADDMEEVACETPPETFDPFRNGLSDDSFYIWPDKRIPYVIDESFNETAVDNIKESIEYYNIIFDNCIKWVPRGSESVYVDFSNSGTCFSKIGRAYWPFPLAQSINIGKCAHLVGHIKHEMMHTLGFYHEHSRSDRDMYVDIRWNNIAEGRSDQFQTYRWTTGYGEKYDYDSIMHYSKTAFSKSTTDMTIVPKFADPDLIGKKVNLSETDIVKIKKLYKCSPYDQWENGCDKDEECGFNEYCTTLLSGLVGGQCRTKLSDGSLCVRSQECLNTCSGGVCSSCSEDSQCQSGQFCANKYLPFAQNVCSSYCGEICLVSAQCGGSCPKCTWGFTCQPG